MAGIGNVHSGSSFLVRNIEGRQAGFTLLELMVALFVFALISVAGVGLLHSATDAQARLKDRLDRQAQMTRLSALIEKDLVQALSRPYQKMDGRIEAAFVADNRGSISFSRIGQVTGSSLSDFRIAYEFSGDRLMRTPENGEHREVVLLSNVQMLKWRFRDDAGEWQESWPISGNGDLPRAAELVIQQKPSPPFRLLFLVGSSIRRPFEKGTENE